MFTGDLDDMTSDISKLTPKVNNREFENMEQIASMWEKELPEYSLRSKILLEQVHIKSALGEYTGLELHSLNNTLSTWEYSDPKCSGVMFDDGLFDPDEIIALSCGFVGDHPYNFVVKTTPLRPKQFQLVRSKVNKFLAHNDRWRIVVNHILQELDETDVVNISIFNPLNFLGMINDIYKENSSKRIPSLNITVTKEDGTSLSYYGSLFWVNRIPLQSPKDVALKVYGSLDKFIITSLGNSCKKQEVSVSEYFGLSYEVVSSNGKIVTIADNICSYESFAQLDNLQVFLNQNDGFIDQVGELFNELPIV